MTNHTFSALPLSSLSSVIGGADGALGGRAAWESVGGAMAEKATNVGFGAAGTALGAAAGGGIGGVAGGIAGAGVGEAINQTGVPREWGSRIGGALHDFTQDPLQRKARGY